MGKRTKARWTDALIEFGGDVEAVAHKHYRASLLSEEAFPYLQALHEEYDSLPKRPPLRPWIKRRLAGVFQSVGAPPRWITGPAWPWFEAEPMIFIGQFELKKASRVAREALTYGTTLYVFGHRVPVRVRDAKGKLREGFEVRYQIVEQER